MRKCTATSQPFIRVLLLIFFAFLSSAAFGQFGTGLSLSIAPNSVQGGLGATGTVTATLPLFGNAYVVSISSNNAAAVVPPSITIPVGQVSANFAIATTPVPSTVTATISVSVPQGAKASAKLTILPTVQVTSIVINPTKNKMGYVEVGSSATATITINSTAPTGGFTVPISVSPAACASVPATVTVPAGSTTTTFSFSGLAPCNSASLHASNASTPLEVVGSPLLSINPTTVMGGSSATGTFSVAPAAAGNFTINLSSSDPTVTVPLTATVATGQTSVQFTIRTTASASNRTAVITASDSVILLEAGLNVVNGQLKSLTLNPTSVTGGLSSTATLTLTSPIGGGGLIVGLTSDSSFATVPTSITVPTGAISAQFQVATSGVVYSESAIIRATVGSQSVSAQLQVAPPTLQSITLNPSEVTGGSPSTATITLSGPAPSGGTLVTLYSNNAGATPPFTVLVPGNAISVQTAIATIPTSQTIKATITAAIGKTTQTALLTIDSPVALSLSLNPTSVVGGSISTATFTLTGPAPRGGVTATVTSGNPTDAQVPSSITVPAGSASTTFKVTTVAVNSTTSVTLTATAGTTVSATLTVASSYYFDYPTFPNTIGLELNGNAFLSAPTITLTNGYTQASSMFYTGIMDVSGFQTQFEFMMSDNAAADGITFCVTTGGPGSLGGDGGDLGYAGINHSVAIKYDLWDNVGDDANSTGLFTNGVQPFDPSISLAPIYLASGDKMLAKISYANKQLTVITTDESTGATSKQTYAIDIPATIGSNMAYVGFTGSTGAATALIRMFSWMFQGGL